MIKAALSNKNAIQRAPRKLEEFVSGLAKRKVASAKQAGDYASALTSRLTEVRPTLVPGHIVAGGSR